MAAATAPPSPQVAGAHLVLYDGVCGLCNRLLQFVIRRDHGGVFRFASLQSAVGRSIVERSGGDPGELTSFYVIAEYQTPAARMLDRSDAAVFVAGVLGWPWRAVRLIRFVPRALRDRAYDVVARSRYRVFGRFDHCLIPSPELRNRFIDTE
jgi:predicted DCC family thiol-disulfide oxidoreductase YuxK